MGDDEAGVVLCRVCDRVQGTQAVLLKADLRDADLAGALLRGADLRSAKLQGANLAYADLDGALLPAGIGEQEGPGSGPGPR